MESMTPSVSVGALSRGFVAFRCGGFLFPVGAAAGATFGSAVTFVGPTDLVLPSGDGLEAKSL